MKRNELKAEAILMVRSWVESRKQTREEATKLGLSTAARARAAVNVVRQSPVAPPVIANPPSPPVIRSSATAQSQRAQALVSVIRGIGSPLQSAVSEVAAGLRERGQTISAADETRAFAQLVQQVVSIGRSTFTALEIGPKAVGRWNGEPLRWSALEAISDIVGAHYRAAGLLQPSGLVGQMVAAVTQIAVDGAKREDLMPGLGHATQARLGLDMLKAIPPVVHAVARHTFGRTPAVLVTEIAWELQYKAVEATRRLLPKGASLDDWHSVYGAFMGAAGQLYAEAHFAESDRLARLETQTREHSVVTQGQTGRELPMTAVWDTFDRKLDLLASFSGYMAMPPVQVQA